MPECYANGMESARTTITLDRDIATQLKALARRRRISLETALDTAVRNQLAAEPVERMPFRVEARPMGLLPGIDLTHALQLAGDLEDEEILRKLECSK